MQSPSALIILDGFGYSKEHEHNAIYAASPANFQHWLLTYPSALLKASGISVGLLDSMIGNSEVGHLTIGSGRIIKQPVAVLTDMINSGELFKNPLLLKRFKELKITGNTLHLMGLLSDAGVHSHEYHLYGLLNMAVAQGIKDIVVHPFLDGRDVPPKSAAYYLTKLDQLLHLLGAGRIGSMHGRFYAMDRDHNWQRTQVSYNTLTQAQPRRFTHWQEALDYSYAQGITDEFFYPTQLESEYFQSGDALIFFNFRADRARQLTSAIIDRKFHAFKTSPRLLSWMLTATHYSPSFHTDVLYYKQAVRDTFFDVLQEHNKKIFTIAETEKYAHVTYFFNGGLEKIRSNETRILIPSIGSHLTTYASHPAMSADAITQTVLTSLSENPRDFYLINYANADMVGHSGDFQATTKAITILDEQLAKLFDVLVTKLNGTLYITGDHGKAEEMWDNLANQPRTAHTNNPVFFLAINNSGHLPKDLPLYELSDIAPFILKQLKLPVPTVMTQVPL